MVLLRKSSTAQYIHSSNFVATTRLTVTPPPLPPTSTPLRKTCELKSKLAIGNFELSIAKFDSSFCIIVCRTTRAYKFIIELNFYALIYDYHLPPSSSSPPSSPLRWRMSKGKEATSGKAEGERVLGQRVEGGVAHFGLGWNILC